MCSECLSPSIQKCPRRSKDRNGLRSSTNTFLTSKVVYLFYDEIDYDDFDETSIIIDFGDHVKTH